MLVVVAAFDLDIDFAQSLKDKRQVVRSLKDKIRSHFEVSVIEAGFQDVHQRARLAVAFLAHDHAYADATLDKIEAFVESNADAAVGDFTTEKIELE
ncbi:MAG TPA: DUF503 domain-containing protein [Thermoanaerobaculia bacterium]